ncbi:FecR family protein [Aestuariivivens insulae]|uniref:FecR family protein n=1 Tax=Aestuariivivens insulae TaxID=1621988 RepID=UPI001F5A74BF|nr:FecR family protein [Aestuariivivens insulae]
MSIFNQILSLSKKIATSLLKDEAPEALEDSELFNQQDKEYIINNLTDETLIKERLNLLNQIDKQNDWQQVKSKINHPVKKMFIWRYAAAIVIGLLATTLFFKDKWFHTATDTGIVPKVVSPNPIVPGEDKATLTLEDGSQIALEKGEGFQLQNAVSNGQEIVYNSADNLKKEVVYNTLTIPRGGQYQITLADGTKVWLNSESQLKFPVSFIEGKTRVVELEYGEAYFEVSPSTNHKGAHFKVINEHQEIEVLGTEFNIKAYGDENEIYTTLVEGKVRVSNADSQLNLEPGQQSKINLKDSNITVKTVDVYSVTSWRKGLFSFKRMPLNDIMKVLSRWYDVEIHFANSELEQVKFNGVLSKNDKLEEILDAIKNTNFINAYEINNNKITIK